MALMTSLLGSKNPNPSLATILMPTTSFAQKRADKQADMAYTQKLFELEQQTLQQKQAEEKKVKDAFNYVNSLDILEPDKKRLQVFSDSLEQKIVDKIKNKYGGNIRKYMMEEGEMDLYEYQQGLITSNYMKDALTNKTNKGQYDIADVDGKVHRKVSWTTADGTKKTGTFEEAYMDYANYKTQKLNYAGAYEAPKKAHEYFSKTFSPRGHYAGDEPTPEEVYATYVGSGMTPEDAADYYDRYYASGMYRYKMGDKEALALKAANYDLQAQKFNADQYWKKMGYNLSVAKLNAQDRHNQAMEKKSSGGADGEYNYFEKDILGIYEKKGDSYVLKEGAITQLEPAALNDALGGQGGGGRPFSDKEVFVGDVGTNPVKIGAANAYSTGELMVVGGKVYERVRVSLARNQALESGLIYDNSGLFSSGYKVNDEFAGKVIDEGEGTYRVDAWAEFTPSAGAAVSYSRAISGRTARKIGGHVEAPTQEQSVDYSSDVDDFDAQ